MKTENSDREYEITVRELKQALDAGERISLIDVREPYEYGICSIKGTRLVPVDEIASRVSEFSLSHDYVFYCHTGVRSALVVSYLRQLGFKKVKNLKGGIDAWANEIDPSMPRY